MIEPIYHTVTVTSIGEAGKTTDVYRYVVAIGMGHKLPNLVLVQRAPGEDETVTQITHLHIDAWRVRRMRVKKA